MGVEDIIAFNYQTILWIFIVYQFLRPGDSGSEKLSNMPKATKYRTDF